MKILFINPSLRLGSDMRFLPVGLGYVMTYVKQFGYEFDLLDIDGRQLQDDYIEKYFQENKYDVILVGAITIVGNSVGGSIPEVLFQTTKVDIVVYGEAEITVKEVFDAIKSKKTYGEIVEPRVEIPHANKGYPATIKGTGIDGIIYRTKENLIVNNGKRKAVRNIDDTAITNSNVGGNSAKVLDTGTIIA